MAWTAFFRSAALSCSKTPMRGGRLTWAELHQALLDDYQGHERVRQMLAHSAPRFGNGDPEVDQRQARDAARSDGETGKPQIHQWPGKQR